MSFGQIILTIMLSLVALAATPFILLAITGIVVGSWKSVKA